MEPSGRASEEHTPAARSSPAPSRQVQDNENGYGTKATQILAACRRKDVDALRAFSTSEGGLVSDEVRCKACSSYQEDISCPRLTGYRASTAGLQRPGG